MHTLYMIDPHQDIKLTLIIDKCISWLAVILTVLPSTVVPPLRDPSSERPPLINNQKLHAPNHSTYK